MQQTNDYSQLWIAFIGLTVVSVLAVEGGRIGALVLIVFVLALLWKVRPEVLK